jgi:chemotaxis protein MotA
MISIIGFVVVIVGVIGGFLEAGGDVGVLFQPAEFIVIGGAMIGGLLISTPMATLKAMLADMKGIFQGKTGPDKATYLEVLLALNELFQIARKDGIIALESHVNDPKDSKIFKKYPMVLNNHHAIFYICDTIKLFLAGSVPAHEIEMLMDAEIDSHHEEAGISAGILTRIADALPGLGIVAAVLGIIITMGAIDGDPAVIGKHVAAALVGTFLGVLLAYGFFGPMAANLEVKNRNDARLLHVIKSGISAFAKGMAPSVSIEFARRSIFHVDRPSFDETEQMLKDAKKKNK